MLVEIPCPVCDSRAHDVWFPDTLGDNPPIFGYKWVPEVRKAYRMVRCRECRHVYASPRLVDLYKYYVDNVDDTYVVNEPLRTATARRVIAKIREFTPKGRLLDVGCATGDFLAAARPHFDVEGLELSDWARASAESKGLSVHKKLIAELTQSDTRYDVVTLWGVIEHMEFPLEELQRINRMINPGGLVCLWTGDIDDILARMLGPRWWYVMGQHLQLFSRSSLDRLMRRAGFEPVWRGVYPYVINLEYLGKILGRYPLVGWWAERLLGLPTLRNIAFTLKLPDQIFDIYRKAGEPAGR